MAGFNVGALPYFIQYQGELQQQAQRQQAAEFAKQQQQQQMLAFQQQQQDRQRAQAAQTAAGNALPQLLQGGQVAAQPQQGQMPPPPQPPAPGQASQPMQPPQGAPLPGQGPAGQVVRPPLPPGGVQGVAGQGAQPPLPPFRPMPTTPPQSAAPQGAIPAPPAQAAATSPADRIPGGGLTLQGAVEALRGQGLEGADLMAGLQQLTPVLDAASKQQAAQLQTQFNNELKLQTLKDRHDAWVQASQDRQASVAERAAAAEQANATRLQIGQMTAAYHRDSLAQRAQAAQGTPDQKIDPEVSHFMAQQYLAAPDPSIFTNLGRGKQGAANVLQLRKDIMAEAKAQGLTPQDVAALGIGVAGEKAFSRAAGTRAAGLEIAGSAFQQVSPIVREASAKLPRTQSLDINAVLNAAQTRTGDPRWVTLGQAMDTAMNSYARAISPTGVPTEGSRARARAHFSENMTPEQIDAVLGVMDKEIAAERKAPVEVSRAQRERISGKPAEGAGGPVKINSDADYANLPSGAEFIAPDGSHRRKP